VGKTRNWIGEKMNNEEILQWMECELAGIWQLQRAELIKRNHAELITYEFHQLMRAMGFSPMED
jgi:hypothetical protein